MTASHVPVPSELLFQAKVFSQKTLKGCWSKAVELLATSNKKEKRKAGEKCRFCIQNSRLDSFLNLTVTVGTARCALGVNLNWAVFDNCVVDQNFFFISLVEGRKEKLQVERRHVVGHLPNGHDRDPFICAMFTTDEKLSQCLTGLNQCNWTK